MSEEEIIDLCDLFSIENYTIKDGLVNVDGGVDLRELDIPCFPVVFGTIYGDFQCSNNRLTSLKGSPHTVHGSFDCSSNSLTDLEHCPKIIGDLDKKTGTFYASKNKINTLEYCPEIVGSAMAFDHNEISSLDGFDTDFGGNFFCNLNPIGSIFAIVQKDFVKYFKSFKVIKGGELNLKRLKYLLSMKENNIDINKDINLDKIKKHYTLV